LRTETANFPGKKAYCPVVNIGSSDSKSDLHFHDVKPNESLRPKVRAMQQSTLPISFPTQKMNSPIWSAARRSALAMALSERKYDHG
jgi:hypothetical protein